MLVSPRRGRGADSGQKMERGGDKAVAWQWVVGRFMLFSVGKRASWLLMAFSSSPTRPARPVWQSGELHPGSTWVLGAKRSVPGPCPCSLPTSEFTVHSTQQPQVWLVGYTGLGFLILLYLDYFSHLIKSQDKTMPKVPKQQNVQGSLVCMLNNLCCVIRHNARMAALTSSVQVCLSLRNAHPACSGPLRHGLSILPPPAATMIGRDQRETRTKAPKPPSPNLL